MILDSLVFALGFLVAGLFALAALPAIWRRALRLSSARLARLVPLSPDEIAAERDHLRAAHAVDLRRTEQRLDRAEADRAVLMAEASRRDDRIAVLDRDAAAAQAAIARLTDEAQRLERELSEIQAEVGASAVALHGATDLAEKRWLETVELRRENQGLADQVNRDRASLAALETRALGATTRADDLARDLDRARLDLAAAAVSEGSGEAEPPRARDRAALLAQLTARDHDIDHLTAELAFMNEQAASAERRAKEAILAYERLGAERARAPEAVTESGPAVADDHARLRAAIGRLADDVLRATSRPERADEPVPSDAAGPPP